MKTRSIGRVLRFFTVTLVAGPAGCYPPIPEPPPPEPEHRWCVYADPATGWRADENLQPITDPDTGLWMSGCTCLCPEDHAVMVAGVNGMLAPGSDAETFYESQVAILRTDTGGVPPTTDATAPIGSGSSLGDTTGADATTNTDATSDGSGTTSGGVVIDRLRSG